MRSGMKPLSLQSYVRKDIRHADSESTNLYYKIIEGTKPMSGKSCDRKERRQLNFDSTTMNNKIKASTQPMSLHICSINWNQARDLKFEKYVL